MGNACIKPPNTTMNNDASTLPVVGGKPEPANETILNLAETSTDEIEKRLRELGPDAVEINISKNELLTLPSQLSSGKQTKRLIINSNLLTDLNPIAGWMPNLTHLDCSDNKVTTLPDNLFSLSLVKLEAYKLELSDVPESMFECTTLEEVNFFNNKISKFPVQFNKLTNLQDLNLSSNKIMQIPANSLDGLRSLTRLALFWNKIIKCNASFKDLESLQVLQMYDNRLMELPEFGESHPKLERIELTKNNISTIPEELFIPTRFPSLEAFEINNNSLTTIPRSFARLTKLTKLALANNKLATLPAEICQMKTLQYITIANNQFTELPDFTQCTNLVTLYFDGNKITKLQEGLLKLQKIVRFSSKGNPLDRNDAATVNVLQRITVLVKERSPDGTAAI